MLEETILVLDGAAETTRTVIGSTVRELALRPDVQRLLRQEPGLLTNAVEEFIRWVSPILNMRRTVTRSHDLHGQHLAAGDELLLLYPSANRDERAYDRPDEFDVTRDRNHHVAFGFGTHVCLGAALARLELRVMFEQLLSGYPNGTSHPARNPRSSRPRSPAPTTPCPSSSDREEMPMDLPTIGTCRKRCSQSRLRSWPSSSSEDGGTLDRRRNVSVQSTL